MPLRYTPLFTLHTPHVRNNANSVAYGRCLLPSSVDRVALEGTRDVKTALKKGLDSGLSQALNASAPAAHPEWRQVAPAVSEILQSIAKDMLAVAGKNQSAVVLDMVAVRSTNKALQARGMGDVDR